MNGEPDLKDSMSDLPKATIDLSVLVSMQLGDYITFGQIVWPKATIEDALDLEYGTMML
jgi:hypothetical protein